jgi:hypothetical protein
MRRLPFSHGAGLARNRALVACTFRIGRDVMLMRHGPEGCQALVIGIRCLDLFAILNGSRLGRDGESRKNRERQTKARPDAA